LATEELADDLEEEGDEAGAKALRAAAGEVGGHAARETLGAWLARTRALADRCERAGEGRAACVLEIAAYDMAALLTGRRLGRRPKWS
jgi:hypothetical protein